MKKLIALLIVTISLQTLHAQNITARVVDSLDNKPLAYAIVIFDMQKHVMYTDANGYFTLNKDSISKNDTVIIQFLGYKSININAAKLKDGAVYAMEQVQETLSAVTIAACTNTKQYEMNKHIGRIRQYIGPGPETRLVVIARYINETAYEGFVNKISVYVDEVSATLSIPVRLRWYEWDELHNAPGKELTDTSIIIYPSKSKWNDFIIPPRTIFCQKDGIVFGLEFIYPAEYLQQYNAIKSSDEKIKWLTNMQNRWSLGMEYTRSAGESGFYIIDNNVATNKYDRKFDRYYIRPAIKFTITVCKD